MRAVVVSTLARRPPWWVVALVGSGCAVLGAWLISEPFRSLSVLFALVTAGMLLSGIGEVMLAWLSPRPVMSWIVGAIWIVLAAVCLAWPGLTVLVVAVWVGVGLILGGIARIAVAITGIEDDRLVAAVNGVTGVVTGVLALTWPAITVLVLAVLFGVRLAVVGIGLIAVALQLRSSVAGVRPRRRLPRQLRLVAGLVALIVALGGTAISVAIHRAAQAAPTAFYTAPSPLPAAPLGTILRDEVIPGFVADATTYRVLYLSTGYDGKPAAVSGVIVVPDSAPPADGREILAYTHGTTGVASACAPSLHTDPATQPLLTEGGALFVKAGYVIAASDYQGLGTAGPHPYLVGKSEGENELDIVRAARNLSAAHAGNRFAVWGHSQGGHASLFTGQLATGYAPELNLVGVAAGGPVPNLVDLFAVNIKTTAGKVLIAMALQSWEQVYNDAKLEQIVTRDARPLLGRIARNCLYNTGQLLSSVPAALALNLSFLSNPPWQTEPWKTIVEQNDPGQIRVGVPTLLVQATEDGIIHPAITKNFADRLCASGETVDLLSVPGGHVATGQVAAPDVAAWIADRFAGKPAPTTCSH